MKPTVSVVMTIRNVELYIYECIKSILDQTFSDLEVIIVDDASKDRTKMIVEKFTDKRIKYCRNIRRQGIVKNRNRGIQLASGKFLFFIDGDCVASKDWVKEGVENLKDPACIGVEGQINYVSENYEPTFSDHVMENKYGGTYMTGNMAYKKSIIADVGGFDENLSALEDRDLAFRAMKRGKIIFNPNMVVCHRRVILTPRSLMKRAAYTKNRVYLFKKSGERKCMFWRILLPSNLAAIVFPPLILSKLVFDKVKTPQDFRLLPFTYIFAIYERLQIWKECAKQRVFLI